MIESRDSSNEVKLAKFLFLVLLSAGTFEGTQNTFPRLFRRVVMST